ncbi:DUF4381 domain-containing protein [Microbulbifer sp. YPW1]|uniref:DUF4381 domain-containing protein n=1 Tax=Microbulbifer sp. YPW1 TaxID=2745199 RepID=UPI001599CB52|nr:DUF4381 domain-containing protein [Microbulbifer sp. YPW1]QKX17847.1 DUF4381 domain-containing protein [Microbulbifer sp. YPW1]
MQQHTPPPNENTAQPPAANTNPAASEETLPDMLAQLVPPPEPAAISLWPATPLAQGLAFLLLAGLLYLAWRWLRRYRANAYRRAAEAELGRIADDPAQIAEILRRTALAAYPRQQVAGLTGARWLEFLNRHYPGNGFQGEAGQLLLLAPYQKIASTTVAELADEAKVWIRQHKSEPHPQKHFRGQMTTGDHSHGASA